MKPENSNTSDLVSQVNKFDAALIKERAAALLARMGIDLVLLLFMTVTLVIVVLVLGGRLRLFQPSVGFPIVIVAGVVIVKRVISQNRFRQVIPFVLRDWLPFVLISFIYQNLYVFSKQIMTSDLAPLLFRIDVRLFGVEPTIWMQRFFSPGLTDLMALCYALYFVLPLSLMFFLSLDERRRELRQMVIALTMVFIMGFTCYVLFPCNPPRYLIPHLYTSPVRLHGLIVYDVLQGTWDRLSVISGGAFPSLHVAISSVALIYALLLRRLSRLYRWLCLAVVPLSIGLWISTIYLRHHWFVDIIAGWVVALMSVIVAHAAVRFEEQR